MQLKVFALVLLASCFVATKVAAALGTDLVTDRKICHQHRYNFTSSFCLKCCEKHGYDKQYSSLAASAYCECQKRMDLMPEHKIYYQSLREDTKVCPRDDYTMMHISDCRDCCQSKGFNDYKNSLVGCTCSELKFYQYDEMIDSINASERFLHKPDLVKTGSQRPKLNIHHHE